MPSSAPRACRCGGKIGDDGRCPRCSQAQRTIAARAERPRLSACKRGYGRRWRRESKEYLKLHPLCIECRREGKLTPATCVDHKRPHRGDAELFWDQRNWQPMCIPHHDRKTAREDGGFGRRPSQ